MIQINCDECGEEINELSGLKFSAPNEDMTTFLKANGFKFKGVVTIKTHICIKCNDAIEDKANFHCWHSDVSNLEKCDTQCGSCKDKEIELNKLK